MNGLPVSDPAFDELSRVTKEFARAIVSNDAEQIGAFLAHEWVLVTPESGPVSREHFLHAVSSRMLRHDTMTIDVTRVKLYGEIAVVTGRGANTGAFNGEPISADEWTTDIYRKTGSRWLCVLTQLTPVQRA